MANVRAIVDQLQHVSRRLNQKMDSVVLATLLVEARDLLSDLSWQLRSERSDRAVELRFTAEVVNLYVTAAILDLQGAVEGTTEWDQVATAAGSVRVRSDNLVELHRQLYGG